MSTIKSWNLEYQQEITHARHARSIRNEGMARVCARRAAGLIICEYFHRKGLTNLGPSAYQHLKLLESIPDLDPKIKQVANHFLLTVDKDFNLPDQIDLISEAEWLKQELLKDK